MAKMTIAQRRDYVMDWFGRKKRYQFGQPPQTVTLVQESGCTDTCIQHIVKLTKNLDVSLNEVRRRSGAPANDPMNTVEALRALHSFRLPYEMRTDLGAAALVRIARTRGPVILCEMYWAHPQWQGYVYGGIKNDGVARNEQWNKVKVGFSHPLKRSGLTQNNFRLGHAVLVGTDDYRDGTHYAVVRDPNHNSASRPERPAFDLITMPQLTRMILSFRSHYGIKVALVPTRTVITRRPS